ncbi:creatininase family protein [Amycolatopsis sp. lyj-90]|uniref:creatininase family protein n=1 Tax=Amycolatopsis sp. lyj-90 TaxID=2789285 RepID=UPI00397CA5E7
MNLFPTTTTADERARDADVAVLPVGSFEQHGAHLPLATDAIIATTIADALASAYPVLRLPPITIACSHEHADWPGTVSISAATLYAVVNDVAASLRRSGVPKLVLVNAHGGNYVLSNVVQESTSPMALFPGVEGWQAAHGAAGLETSLDSDMHAGELETSLLLHAHPALVRPGFAEADHLADDRRHLLTTGLRPYSESGVVGRPSLATAEKGRLVLESLVRSFGDTLTALA